MRTAIIADWLPTFGGAEHVVQALHDIWPKAPIFTTVARHERLGPLSSADIRTSWLQRSYRLIGRHQYLLPFMPRVVENFDLSEFDVIISSSHAVGKGIIPPSKALHICYCHTPMRYAWEMEDEYLKDFRVREPFKSRIRRELKRLRRWDLSTAKRVDAFISNSTETARRISRIYGRESTVIPPPVEDKFFQTPLRESIHHPLSSIHYFLAIGRLVPYKRFDLLIDLANKMRLPLKIGGTGQEWSRLKAMAGPTVELMGHVPDSELPGLYSGAQALLFPQIEDAGIVPLESLASGTPVIAFGKGGVLDALVPGITGMLADEQSVEAFEKTVLKAEKISWNRRQIRELARRFSGSEFRKQMEENVGRIIREYSFDYNLQATCRSGLQPVSGDANNNICQ